MNNKSIRRDYAEGHIKEMAAKYADRIESSIANSCIYSGAEPLIFDEQPRFKTEFVKLTNDTVSALFSVERNKRVSLLNFASYKYPGGGFINGAMAQEEALCSESDLYNILSAFDGSYYERHRKASYGGNGLYTSDMIYTPDVIFERKGLVRESGVITCAAPNAGVARSRGVSEGEIRSVMHERIDRILACAARQGSEIVIVGAFGCGVFRNNTAFVENEWRQLSEGKYKDIFAKIIYSRPAD